MRQLTRSALGFFMMLTCANAVLQGQGTATSPIVTRYTAASISRAPTFTLAPRPSAVFGGPDVDPKYDLTKVIDYRLRSDGGFIAAVSGTGLVAFAPTGKPIGILASWGQGPDQVQGGRFAPALGDTLLYADMGNRRILWITASGKLVRMAPLESRLPEMASVPVGELANHDVVFTSAGIYREDLFPPNSKNARTTAMVVALPRAGAARQLFGIPDVNAVLVPQPGTNGSVQVHLGVMFAPQALLATFNGAIVSGTGDAYELDFRDGSGKVLRTISAAMPRVPLAPRVKQLFVDEQITNLKREMPKADAFREEQLDRVRKAPFSDKLAAYTRIFAGNQKTLWVVDGMTKYDSLWTATGFDRNGAITARLQGRGVGGPRAMTDDRVVLRTVDSDGFVSFVEYQIVPLRGAMGH